MNAIDITKQIGVLVAPISLEKEKKESPQQDLSHVFNVPKLTLKAEHLTSDLLKVLTPNELDVITIFIHQGGCGSGSAMKMQSLLWGSFKGRSIEILRSAILKGGWKLEEVLWDMYPIGFSIRKRNHSCLS